MLASNRELYMRYWGILFLGIVLFLGNMCVAQPKHEVRAVWLTTAYGLDWPKKAILTQSDLLKQKSELCLLLDKLCEANFNTIIFQARIRGDVAYLSSFEPFNEVFAGKSGKWPGYDPLAFVVEECHKRGMELHAWVVAVPLGSDRHVRSLGQNSVVRRYPGLCKRYKGEWYLNPGEPEVAGYLEKIVSEIVEHYDVDGIHLDYIRYPDNPQSFPDRDTYRKYGRGKSLADWRRDNITAIVRRVYHTVKTSKPWVKVSSAPVGKFRDTSRYSSFGWNAYYTVYQDAQGWLKEGIQDLIFPMMYFKDNQFFPFALDWSENAHGKAIVPGLGAYFLHPNEKNWKLGDLKREINFIRRHQMAGQAYYRAQYVVENTKSLLDVLRCDYYQYPALPVVMQQKELSLPAPSELQITDDGSCCELSWKTDVDSLYYYIYASDKYPVDVNDVSNILAVRVQGHCYRHVYVYPEYRKRYYAVTAVDRYGNESRALQMDESKVYEWFHSDGEMLYLPPWWQAESVMISDLVGRSVLKRDYRQNLSLGGRLADGWYRMGIEGGDGLIISTMLYIRSESRDK